jgi:L-malate glycosyltransferase
VHHWPQLHLKLQALQAQGAQVIARQAPVVDWSLKAKVLRKLKLAKFPHYQPYLDLASQQPDMVLVSLGSSIDAAGHPELTQLLLSLGKPFFFLSQFNFEHTTYPTAVRQEAKRIIPQARRFFFVANQNIAQFQHQLAFALPNAEYVQNPVNLAHVAPQPWPSSSTLQLACVARLECGFKAQDLLVKAAADPRLAAFDFQIKCYGTGPDEEFLRELIAYYQVEKRVSLLGHSADIAALWREHHALILPSLGEGTPLSLLEACVCGRPAIATAVGGIPDWLVDGETGYLYTPGSYEALVAALQRALSEAGRWSAMGAAAAAHAQGRFNPQAGLALLQRMQALLA